ncbi:hypothetical protein GCM10023238_00380 [Streptomyces heliomycini]
MSRRANGAAMLFTSAKVNHLNVLRRGRPSGETRVLDMVAADGRGGFVHLAGECANRMSQGHPAHLHHGDEQGVAAGHPQAGKR